MSVPIDPVSRDVDKSAGDGSLPSRHETPTADILPYVLPMFAYVALGGLESYLPQVDSHPSPVWYPIAYGIRVAIIGAMAWYFRSTWRDLRPFPSVTSIVLGIVSGLIVTGLWVGLDGHYPNLPFLGKRISFDPTRMSHAARIGFCVVRLIGLVLVVPLIEELFWRSFLIRWLIDPDFRRVPIGQVTLFSAAVTSVLFAVAHPEWLPALLTGLLWAWLLHQTRSLSACLISHAVANLALGIYVIQFGAWQFW
jgi:uncharacterized protein